MPHKDKDYSKKYYQEHKEKWEKYKNKEKDKIYYEKNKERINQTNKNYKKTQKGKKSIAKDCWKRRGLNMINFDEIYDLYLTTTNCDICDRILTKGNPTTSTTKCMDHCHKTGDFRCILCHSCNTRRK